MAKRAAPQPRAGKPPRTGRLKVFVTPIGFHDAYVAAPSQAAALKAWGASANLFARGVAAVVTDATLAAPALAAPGEVVKVPRGTTAEHIAALGKAARQPRARGKADTAEATAGSRSATRAKAVPRPTPRPRRDALERAEAALAALDDAQRAARRDLDCREAALARERKALEREQAAARDKLAAARERAAAAYAEALAKWRG